MQVNLQRISPVMMEVQVEVPAVTVKAEVDKAYTNLAKKAHIKGFRPGKAPRSVLTHLFADQVSGDVMNNLVNSTLPKVLSEQQLTPVSQPNVEAGKIDANEGFSYKARFEVQPEVNADEIKYEGFELTRPRSTADEKMVEEQLESLRVRHAALSAPEPARAAQAKDVVTIDFSLSVDGKPLKNAGGQGIQAELGSKQLLPELDAALTGKEIGQSFDVEASFPEQHPSQELRGKTATFSVTLQDIKERILPALDDEFAKDVGNFQTLVELRADIHTRLEKALKDNAETALAEQIVEKLNDQNPMEVPPSLVHQQCRMQEQEYVMRRGRGVTREEVQALHDTFHASAEKKVRAGLIMAAIAKKHDIKITDEDFEKGLKELSEETGQNVAKLRVEYRDQNKRTLLLGILLEDKVLDLIEGKSKITDAPEKEESPEAAKG